MSVSGLLVDLDDTLVAFDAVTEVSWTQVCTEYCSAHQGTDPRGLFAAIRKVGDWYWSDAERHRTGRANLIEARRSIVAVALADLRLPTSDAPGIADRYSSVRADNMYLLPGVHSTLELLRSRGIALALLTNGDGAGQRAKIHRFDLARHFAAILIEGEIGVGKPEPDAYREALARLGLPAERVCMVGDNLSWDVEGPQRQGIRAFWIDRKGNGVPAGAPAKPDWIVRSIQELPELLAQPGGRTEDR